MTHGYSAPSAEEKPARKSDRTPRRKTSLCSARSVRGKRLWILRIWRVRRCRMKDEDSIRKELIEKLEKQIENVKSDDTFSYIMNNVRIATLAHVLELDLVNKI